MANWYTTTTAPTYVASYVSLVAMQLEEAAASAHGWRVLALALCDETTLPPSRLGQQPASDATAPAAISVAYLQQQATGAAAAPPGPAPRERAPAVTAERERVTTASPVVPGLPLGSCIAYS